MKEKNVQPLRTAKEIEDMKWALRRYGSVDRYDTRKNACGDSREKRMDDKLLIGLKRKIEREKMNL